MLSFSSNCWLRSWASHDLVWPFTPTLLMNAPKASCMTCAMPGMWFLKAGHCIGEALSVDCSSRVIQKFEEVISVILRSKRPLVSSKWSSTSFTCTASYPPECWPLTNHLSLPFEKGNKRAINLIECERNFTTWPFSIHIVGNDGLYGSFVRSCPSVQCQTNLIS